MGYYGNRGEEVLREDSAPGAGFLPDVCREWEAVTAAASHAGIRVVNVRIAMVLSPKGGSARSDGDAISARRWRPHGQRAAMVELDPTFVTWPQHLSLRWKISRFKVQSTELRPMRCGMRSSPRSWRRRVASGDFPHACICGAAGPRRNGGRITVGQPARCARSFDVEWIPFSIWGISGVATGESWVGWSGNTGGSRPAVSHQLSAFSRCQCSTEGRDARAT